MIYFLLLLVALAIILALLQWVMYCQAKRNEGEEAPDTSSVDHEDGHALRIYYFFSTTCGPCRRVKPVVEKLSQDHTNLISVDIAQHAKLARDFGVAGVPSFIVVENGIIKDIRLGRVSETWLLNWLREA